MKSEISGIVKSVDGNTAHVEAKDAGMCGSCGSCGGCGAGKKQLSYDVVTDPPPPVGAEILFGVESPNLAALSFLVFGIPLTMAILGGVIGGRFVSGDDLTLVLGGVSGLVGGFLLLTLLDRCVPTLRVKTTYIRTISIATQAAATACESDGTEVDADC